MRPNETARSLHVRGRVFRTLRLTLLLGCFAAVSPARATASTVLEAPLADSDSPADNWAVAKPKIVVGLGLLLDTRLTEKLLATAAQDLLPLLPPAQRNAHIEILPNATGAQLVRRIHEIDENGRQAVGAIFIGHAYRTEFGSRLVAADGIALPFEFASAATPALRFLAFLGCSGDEVAGGYHLRQEFARLPGHQVAYFARKEALATGSGNFLRRGAASLLFAKVWDAMKGVAVASAGFDYAAGRTTAPAPGGELRIRIKDVRGNFHTGKAGLEPRFVKVNGGIVGVLGDGPDTSNSGTEYRDLSFPVPAHLFNAAQPCQAVEAASAELTVGMSTVDDYLVGAAELGWPDGAIVTASARGPDGERTEVTDEHPLHIGDNEGPPSGARPEVPTPPARAGRKLDPKERDRFQAELAAYYRHHEFLDFDHAHWPKQFSRILHLKLCRESSPTALHGSHIPPD